MDPLIPAKKGKTGHPRTLDLKRITEGIFSVLGLARPITTSRVIPPIEWRDRHNVVRRMGQYPHSFFSKRSEAALTSQHYLCSTTMLRAELEPPLLW